MNPPSSSRAITPRAGGALLVLVCLGVTQPGCGKKAKPPKCKALAQAYLTRHQQAVAFELTRFTPVPPLQTLDLPRLHVRALHPGPVVRIHRGAWQVGGERLGKPRVAWGPRETPDTIEARLRARLTQGRKTRPTATVWLALSPTVSGETLVDAVRRMHRSGATHVGFLFGTSREPAAARPPPPHPQTAREIAALADPVARWKRVGRTVAVLSVECPNEPSRPWYPQAVAADPHTRAALLLRELPGYLARCGCPKSTRRVLSALTAGERASPLAGFRVAVSPGASALPVSRTARWRRLAALLLARRHQTLWLRLTP